MPNYQAGQFFRGPQKAIIDGYNAFPDALLPSETWCDAVYKITTDKLEPIVHLAGRALHFEYNDWKWFSERYGAALEDINPNYYGVRWFNRRLGDVLKNSHAKTDKDEVYWSVIREEKVASSEVFSLDASPLVIEEEPIKEEVIVEESFTNPLLEEARSHPTQGGRRGVWIR